MAGIVNPNRTVTQYRSPLYDAGSADAPGIQVARPLSTKTDLPVGVARREGLSPLQLAQGPASINRTAQDEAAAPAGVSVAPALEAPREPNPYEGLYNELGPMVRGAINGTPAALRAARDAELRRLQGERGIYGEEQAYLSKPNENDMWLQYGIGMLQPTTTGSFAEGLGNAAAMAGKARAEWRNAEQARQEKLFASKRGLNNLMGGEEKARLTYLQDATKLPGNALAANADLADLQLYAQPASARRPATAGGLNDSMLTPSGDQAVLMDYQSNPGKYAGVAGQAMVKEAYDRLVKAQEGAGPRKLSSTSEKQLYEADEMAMSAETSRNALKSILMPNPAYGGKSLNDTAYSGYFAGYGPGLARLDPTGYLLDDNRAKATTELDNRVIGQALSSLKATFGSAPTEGERKILVDLQASVDKSPAEREAIIKNAMSVLSLREQFNRQKAAAIRDGTYFGPDGAPTLQMPEVYPVPDDLSMLEDGGFYQLDDGTIGQFDAAAGGFNTVDE